MILELCANDLFLFSIVEDMCSDIPFYENDFYNII